MLKNLKNKFIQICKASDDGLRWIENIGTAWRFAGFADEIASSIRHRGYYTNEFYDDVYRGVVYRLPSRNGKPVYFVGYIDPNNDDAARGEIETGLADDNEAAWRADRIAEIAAEKEREYQSAWQLGSEYFDNGETIQAERDTRRELFSELRTLRDAARPDTPTICKTIQDRIRSSKQTIMAAYKRRREIINDHVFRGELMSAFADGAQLEIETAKALF